MSNLASERLGVNTLGIIIMCFRQKAGTRVWVKEWCPSS